MTKVLVTALATDKLPATHVQCEARNLTEAKKVRTESVKSFKRQGYTAGEYLMTAQLHPDSRGCAVTGESRGRWN